MFILKSIYPYTDKWTGVRKVIINSRNLRRTAEEQFCFHKVTKGLTSAIIKSWITLCSFKPMLRYIMELSMNNFRIYASFVLGFFRKDCNINCSMYSHRSSILQWKVAYIFKSWVDFDVLQRLGLWFYCTNLLMLCLP